MGFFLWGSFGKATGRVGAMEKNQQAMEKKQEEVTTNQQAMEKNQQAMEKKQEEVTTNQQAMEKNQEMAASELQAMHQKLDAVRFA
jgi:hypothetical protein